MKTKRWILVRASITLAAIGLVTIFLGLGIGQADAAHLSADATVRYVAPGGNCGDKLPCYAAIQPALDAAQSGDEILIASGTYTGVVTNTLGIAQMAVITQSVTLRGGYVISDWEHTNPISNPTILDAENAGRIFYISGPVTATIENLSIVNGNAVFDLPVIYSYGSGGGMFVMTATVLLSNTVFQGNQAGIGGGIYAQNSHITLRNSTIASNSAYFNGGGVYLQGDVSSLVNNLFEGNQSGGNGGALSVHGGNIELSDNRIQDNSSIDYGKGGGVEFLGVDGVINGNTVTGNGGFSGGGLFLTGNIDVYDNTISQNSAGGVGADAEGGGGIEILDGDIILVGNTISGNYATMFGGGISIPFGNLPHSGQQILAGNLISGNISENGGGLYLDSVQTTFSHNEIIGNHADGGRGGGIYITDSRFMTVSNVSMSGDKILRNTAEYSGPVPCWSCLGGGIFIDQKSILNATNLVLVGNSAASEGSAIYLVVSALDLAQATIADNPGASGVYISSNQWFHSQVTMTNSIVTGHTTGITASLLSTVTLDGILWFDNQTNTGGPATFFISNAITGDPAFYADGYHISGSSAARDAGVPSGVLLDIDGEPRPYGKFDLGADEFWPSGILTRLFLPYIHR